MRITSPIQPVLSRGVLSFPIDDQGGNPPDVYEEWIDQTPEYIVDQNSENIVFKVV